MTRYTKDQTLRGRLRQIFLFSWRDCAVCVGILAAAALLCALALPAAASEALGEDLTAKDTQLHDSNARSCSSRVSPTGTCLACLLR